MVREDQELGAGAVCCLLYDLVPGGSGRQWINLLDRHVQRGGKATIVAPPGPLGDLAEAAGIEIVPHVWDDRTPQGCEHLWPLVGAHDVAVVQWDYRVMHAFEPALAACGRAVLAVHQTPAALARWFGPEIVPGTRVPLARAVASRRATVLVRGEWHRRRFVEAFGLPARKLRILPASIPLPATPGRPAGAEPTEVLALTRLSREKAPIVQLAAELVRARLEAGHECRLTVAGEGAWRDGAIELCERRLPGGGWQLEPPPRDPIARLAAAELVVAQGLTTLEAAALERRVVVARALDEERAAGTVLTPDRYDVAARDPFGRPVPTDDPGELWDEAVALEDQDLIAIRRLVEERNSLAQASAALAAALAATAPGRRARIASRLKALR